MRVCYGILVELGRRLTSRVGEVQNHGGNPCAGCASRGVELGARNCARARADREVPGDVTQTMRRAREFVAPGWHVRSRCCGIILDV
jgi:hypothetical protein